MGVLVTQHSYLCQFIVVSRGPMEWLGSAGLISVGGSHRPTVIGSLWFQLELPKGICDVPQLPANYYPPNKENQGMAISFWLPRGRAWAHTDLEEKGDLLS